jgi:hypothetical protein
MDILELITKFNAASSHVETREAAFEIAKILPIEYTEHRLPFSQCTRSAAIYFAGTGLQLCASPDFN